MAEPSRSWIAYARSTVSVIVTDCPSGPSASHGGALATTVQSFVLAVKVLGQQASAAASCSAAKRGSGRFGLGHRGLQVRRVMSARLPTDAHSNLGGSCLGMTRGAFQSDRGYVDCGDQPAARGQPDRASALTAADVQRRARRPIGDGLDQPLVEPAAPTAPRSRRTARPRPPAEQHRRHQAGRDRGP